MLLVVLVGKQYVDAHPGRTDSSGCHTCRTNCASWGLKQGEYHCHNGGSSSSGSGSSSGANKSTTTVEPTPPKATTPSIDYATKGKTEGYSFKNTNPDAVLPSLDGQNTEYITAYKESFNQACVELTLSSEKLAVENATRDATTTETVNISTEGMKVITNVYVEKYNDTYEQKETDMFIEIENVANTKAKDDVLNLKNSVDTTDAYSLQKAKKYYKEKYIETYESQTKVIRNLKESVQKEATKLGKENSDKEYTIIEGYQDYAIYESLKELFDASYDKGVEEGNNDTIYGFIATAILATGGYLCYKKRKIKKATTKI